MTTRHEAVRIIVVAARQLEEAREKTDSINYWLKKAGHNNVVALTVDEMYGLIARAADKCLRQEIIPKTVAEVVGLSFGYFFDDDGKDLEELKLFTATVFAADMLSQGQLMERITEGPAGLFDTSTVAQVRPLNL